MVAALAGKSRLYRLSHDAARAAAVLSARSRPVFNFLGARCLACDSHAIETCAASKLLNCPETSSKTARATTEVSGESGPSKHRWIARTVAALSSASTASRIAFRCPSYDRRILASNQTGLRP